LSYPNIALQNIEDILNFFAVNAAVKTCICKTLIDLSKNSDDSISKPMNIIYLCNHIFEMDHLKQVINQKTCINRMAILDSKSSKWPPFSKSISMLATIFHFYHAIFL